MNLTESYAAPIPLYQQSASAKCDANTERHSTSGKRELSIEELSHKLLLTIDEAARYTGLGLQKLRDISNAPNCQMVMWNGSKRMFKRKKLEEYINSQYSI